MTERIKILFLAANPTDTGGRLRLEKEIREIGEKLNVGSSRDSFELVSEWAVRPKDLQRVLLRHRPCIVHFSGHGSETDGIVLEDDAGKTMFVDKGALARLFEIFKGSIRMVILNACFAKDQAEGLTRTIDFAIGMNRSIKDVAAIVFSAYFYQALSFECTVQEAFDLARNELDLEGIPGSDIPELLTRAGVNTSERLYKVRKSPGDHHPDSPSHGAAATPHVFISYVRENSAAVYRLKEELQKRGVRTWMDRDDLTPGSRWKLAIRRAIGSADFFLACFSTDYDLRNDTWMNEEIHVAVEELRRRRLDRSWLIPVKLSPCEVPEFELDSSTTLRDLQDADLYSDWEAGVQRLAEVLFKGGSVIHSRRQPQSREVDDSTKQMSIKIGKVDARQTEITQTSDESRQDRKLSLDIGEFVTDEFNIKQ